ncbi:transglutaminase family protein [Lyngbya sp. CCY1209]|uniref:transglutaminase family protein n=1 Tax=Lyngbya sp. CCY1209 TaxID=2886103 RepID=UPI002D1FE1F6|nr:transglutaminase family protein [Lyngbya sp. CCY1209]MEB3885134.1 transglutaminase family protein [Lyngbya sp. CCY1209]
MSIKVSLNHQLSYQFERPVILGPHTIGLRPSPHCRTPINSYSLNIEPRDYSITWQQDPYGNYLARVNFPQKSDRLTVTVDLIADLHPINPFDFVMESYAERYPFNYEKQLAKELIPFLEIADSGELVENWVEKNRASDIYTPEFILNINQQLSREIEYTVRLEPGIQTCEETLQKKIGSCRDTGWLLVQILRHYGLAARFVSGYLIQLKEDVPSLDGPPGPEADNADLHAWAEVYIPGAGWIGLDPTSGFLAAEGHIPLVCTAEPEAAAPVQGTAEPCESHLDFSMTVSRHEEQPRVSKPYSEIQWENIDRLGRLVEDKLQQLNVGLTMGGEPTFVSIDDFESPQWQVQALGEEKRQLAGQLLHRLKDKFSSGGGLLHYGMGKWYPGEILPRWALGCYWREDGTPIWRDRNLMAVDGKDYGYTVPQAETVIRELTKQLGINQNSIIPTYELETEELAGFALPILPVLWEGELRWSSCDWKLPDEKLILLKGDSPLGFRLPLNAIAWAEELHPEARVPLTHKPAVVGSEPINLPDNSVRVAMAVEVRGGCIHVFLPPITSARCFLDLITAIENTAKTVDIPVLIEGYTPPGNDGIVGFQITPDPGVIEVNIHPAKNWEELVKITASLYEEARLCRLGTEKYAIDGRRISTGGGAHITIGGKTAEESPLLRRPDLLRSLISYWQNHPSLSYLFSGLFVGPTSQSPRVDEARHESLYELEIAFQELQPGREVPPELVDRLLRNLLIDVTGNTHRSAFCIDKLYPVENYRNQLGLLEFRAFAMPPHPRMGLLQMLLIRSLVAWFWEHPYTQPLIRWGTTLHDRFLLPYFIEEDLGAVLQELNAAGYPFELSWFKPFVEFRFPPYGEITRDGVTLELRHAIEPWHVLGEETGSDGTARYVDSSMERLQVMLRGAVGNSPGLDGFSSRYVVTCNGYPVPLKSTGNMGEYVGGVRFRARQYAALLHPSIESHSPLLFDIIDTWTMRSLGGCTYHVNPPNGIIHKTFPVNEREAESRMLERFVPMGHTPGKVEISPPNLSPEYPLNLDLRRVNLF